MDLLAAIERRNCTRGKSTRKVREETEGVRVAEDYDQTGILAHIQTVIRTAH